jgi:transcriptional regulatory protein GAL4
MEWRHCRRGGRNRGILVSTQTNSQVPVLTCVTGNSSGTTLLRTISDLIPEKPEHSPANTDQTGVSPSLSINLANTATLDSLIDAYFMWYNPSYPVLHEKTFREKHQNRKQIHPRSSWHPIFFLVLAIGHWILAEGSEAEPSPSGYYTAARSRMSMRMLESGTLQNVQAFLLMVCAQ